jgi:hypothetical protein
MSTSYSQLLQDVLLTTENDADDFITEFPQMVMRSQHRIHRDLDTYGFVSFVTVSAAMGDPLITKPSAALAPKHLYRLSGTRREPMILRTDEFLDEYWPDRTSVGTPKYYANWGYSQFLIAPAPTEDTIFEFAIVRTPVALDETTSTNWLTNYAPELIFNAVMVEANKFMKHWAAAAVWDGHYKESIAAHRNEARRTRRDDQTSPQGPGENDGSQ